MPDLFKSILIHSVMLVLIVVIFYFVHTLEFDYGNKDKKLRKEIVRSFIEGFNIAMKGGRVVIAFAVSLVMFMAFAIAFSLVPLYFEVVGLIGFQIGLLQSLRSGAATVIKLGVNKALGLAEEVTVLTIGMIGTGVSIIFISMIESRLWLMIFSVL
ncbi:MAG: hypothetical protein ACLFU5_04510 [Thermoplasmata archaeon]